MPQTPSPTRHEFRVQNLDCENEAANIRRGLEGVPGVLDLKIYSSAAKITLTVEPAQVTPEQFKERLTSMGFPVTEGTVPAGLPEPWKNPKVVSSAILGILLGAAYLLEHLTSLPAWMTLSMYGIAMMAGGYYFGREAAEKLVYQRIIGIEMLMSVAAIVAFIMGKPEEGGVLVFLYSISEAAEGYTEQRTRSAIRALMNLTPKRALILQDGREEEIPAEDLRVGHWFVVRPGSAIPTDGIIRRGASAINEAPVTGESMPVDKGEGDVVFAGTINGSGALEVEATKAFQENTISRIIHLVEEAQEEKGESQKIIQRFGQRYSPAVLAFGVLLALVPPLLGAGWETWILRATVFIVSAAPCALVISVPITIVAAIGTASRRGILVKGGVYLEQLASTRVLCIDKTGTLTRGTPQVTDILPMNETTPARLLGQAAAAEKRSEHPLAGAILRRAREEGLDIADPSVSDAFPGAGIRAEVDGNIVIVGTPAFLTGSHGHDLSAAQDSIDELQDEGKTVVAVASDDKLLGLLALRDELRPNAREAVARLHTAGLDKVIMLTGDNASTARAIAHEAGIDEVFAELSPEQKAQKVKELADACGNVAMVGDGVNDAPALASASVGIAMGAAGTDVALETADVALMADDLSKLAEAIRLSRRANRLIRQNLWLSVVVISALVTGAVSGVFTLPMAVIGHELSEFAVIGNGMRMLRG